MGVSPITAPLTPDANIEFSVHRGGMSAFSSSCEEVSPMVEAQPFDFLLVSFTTVTFLGLVLLVVVVVVFFLLVVERALLLSLFTSVSVSESLFAKFLSSFR
jgi:hypothetical protein